MPVSTLDKSKPDIADYLRCLVGHGGSDLILSVGAPVNIKVEGVVKALNTPVLKPSDVKKMAYSLLTDEQIKNFETDWELDVALPLKNTGRVRLNLFRERGEVAMVMRFIKNDVPSIAELNLPHILSDIIMEPRGLVLVVGSTGSGKSTTLASMIDHRNTHKTGHILTIEDPIEYLHKHKRSLVNQREIGTDTKSYAAALKRAMREAPDVILIGEIRDRETMQQAITYAETGHLCLSTLHANNANQTLDRIINFFPDSAHQQLFTDLSLNLRAVVSQRLVIGTDGKRVPAVEILLNTPYISELIHKGEIGHIKDAMEHSSDMGMQTFDDSLYNLYQQGKISAEAALEHADSRNNVSLKIRLGESAATADEQDLKLQDT
jgi:twitching motility protein PilU